MLVGSIQNLKIAVIGLGYVGLPLAAAFARDRLVVGFDISEKRISQLKNGFDATNELTTDELQQASNLQITSDPIELAECNFYIITVPTPVDRANRPDLGPLLKATKLVAEFIEDGDIVVYESTVFPGATEEACGTLLSKLSGLTLSTDDQPVQQGTFFLGYSPERINPGDKKHRIKDIVKVTSGSTQAVAELIDELYSTIIDAGTYLAPSIKVAEAAKVIENIQRDVNIALVNELALIFHRLNIDTETVLKAAGTKWNFLPFRPGLVGGHCIGVDPYYLTQKAIEIGHNPEIILAGRRINDSMSQHVAERILKMMLGKRINPIGARVLVLGFAFKENCPDTRNSKVSDLVNHLSTLHCLVDVFDPLVDNDSIVLNDSARVIDQPEAGSYDAIVLAVPHQIFIENGAAEIRSFGAASHIFFDLKCAFSQGESDGRL